MSTGRRIVGARSPSPPAAAERAADFLNLSGWRAIIERVEQLDGDEGDRVAAVTLRATRTVEAVALEVTVSWAWMASQRRWAAQAEPDGSLVTIGANGSGIAAHAALVALDHLAGMAQVELAGLADGNVAAGMDG